MKTKEEKPPEENKSKLKNYRIYYPILFNPYKHHLRTQLKAAVNLFPEDTEDFALLRQLVGHSPMDVYTGEYRVWQIASEAKKIIDDLEIESREDIHKWFKLDDSDYKKVKFKDGSEWIYRDGAHPVKFAHIHPAKNSLNGFRIKPNILLTIIALLIEYKTEADNPTLEKINFVRKKYFDASPIASIEKCTGILRHFTLYNTSFKILKIEQEEKHGGLKAADKKDS